FEPQSVEQRRAWIADVNAKWDAGTDYTMGIFLRGDAEGRTEFIGGTGFHTRRDPDRLAVGYWIDARHEGRGLVTETSAALTRVALELAEADIADISHAPSNERSASVPARLGYVRQGFSGEECFDDGETLEAVTWFATREQLRHEPLASVPRPRVFDEHDEELPWPA
ncbi:GNAT family N-acetyltransferase, partial [uncultured Demequina sp.]|uniref:GNAT family N-acetyltransferase n=1 Tax=uncultured Demequina sp. TaxID=693499 RepID=UPI0025D96627